MSNCHHSRNVIRFAPSLLALAALLTVGLYPRSARSQNPVRTNNPEEYWHSQVEPLLDKSCLKCHAGVRQSGGLDLRSLDTILRGGDSGPAVIPGKPGESRLVQYVLPQPGPHMPPDPKKQLSPEAINTLKTWIALLPVQTEQTKSVPQYMQAYEACLGATSTKDAPWYVVPADDKENARLLISRIVLDTFADLKMRYPKPDAQLRQQLEAVRQQLMKEDASGA